ncbi:MAG: hypothetical protein ABI671_16150 [Burkholderiales bacterium]
MTADVTATFQNLLQHSPTSPVLRTSPGSLPASRWHHEHDTAQSQPILFRSEGFAEDLFDIYPSH